VRDGPNIRRAFDGGVVHLQRPRLAARAFALKTVEIEEGPLNDPGFHGDTLNGAYLTFGDKARALDLYWLGLDRANGAYLGLRGREERDSFGARLSGEQGALDYDIEAIVQVGRLGAQEISAWTLASEWGWTAARAPMRPRLGLKANITSGDDNPADASLETFNPIFPNFSYFNDAALLSPQNHVDLHPRIAFTPARDLDVSLGMNWFWKTERDDAIYRAPGVPVGGATRSRFVARQIDLVLEWRPTRNVALRTALVELNAGDALREAGGRSASFAMLSLTRRF
jgi:hypothetical protein